MTIILSVLVSAVLFFMPLSNNQAMIDSTPVSDAQLVHSIPEHTTVGLPELPHAQAVWLEMIDQTTSTIDIAQMYVANLPGEGIDPVIEALIRAAQRGVKIRFLLSKNMIDNDKPTLERIRLIPNIEVAVIDLKPHTGGILHAKYWIFDRAKIFLGSQNFDWRALTQIHETGIRLNDVSLAAKMTRLFEIDFKIAQTGVMPTPAELIDAPTPTASSAAKTNHASDFEVVASPEIMNPSSMRFSLTALLELIRNSRTSIRFQLLDYSTKPYDATQPDWNEIDDALRAAAARGVKVQVLVSHWNTEKPEIDSIKALSQVPNIEVKICFMPEHPSRGFIPYARVIHSKVATFDDQIAWIGTSNWSKGYFYGTRGVEIIAKRADMADRLNRAFALLWGQTYTQFVDPAREYPPPRKGE